MKKTIQFLMTVLALTGSAVFAADTAFEAERKKALASPYANDFGPEKLTDAQLAAYPAEHVKAYKEVLLVKCAKCHSAARPLNSQFFEVPGKKEEKAANLVRLQGANKDMFKNPAVWQVENDIWQRYVKRMMAKPGCEISEPEGKAVYRFLVYDSEQRKSGKNAAVWKAQREKLLLDFKAKNPARYKELYEK